MLLRSMQVVSPYEAQQLLQSAHACHKHEGQMLARVIDVRKSFVVVDYPGKRKP